MTPPPPYEPQAAVLPRLTTTQYRRTLRRVFGEGLPATSLPKDTNPYLFFTIGASTSTPSETGVQRYTDSAFAIARHVTSDARRGSLLGCDLAAEGCLSGFLRELGQRLFRRPLSAEEQIRYVALAQETGEGDLRRGLRLAIAGMLQSPHFLYRVELGEPDPNSDGRLRYTSWEMASRLSFLLWDEAPDPALLEAAAAGSLLTKEGIRAEANRMLADPRGRESVQRFFAQYLDLGRLDDLERDSERFPQMSPTLGASLRKELELLVDDIVFRRDADLRDLFATRHTFVNEELAALYGIEAEGATPFAFVPVELSPESNRAGLLSLGGFLAMNAHPTQTSPTLRGKYIRERVLCQQVPAPPDDVDLNLDPSEERAPTLRERLEQHRDNPECAACHAFLDPPGYLFEHFDSVGAYRTEAEGYPVDASGDLDGEPVASAAELGTLLSRDERVSRCLVRQLYRHAQGRLEIRAERAALEDLEGAFAAEGHRFQGLLLALVTSEAFRYAAPPTEVEP